MLPKILILCISFIYLSYHALISEMLIFHDAIGYEYLGKLLHNEGWYKYFQTGPNREPLYPFLISISMAIGDNLSIHYQYIQKFFQIIIILVTQALMFKVFERLKVPQLISLASVLYFALSPSVMNSSLRLYSEILTYPVVLSIILCSSQLWDNIQTRSPKIYTKSIFLGLLWTTLTLVKGINEIVALLFFMFLMIAILCLNKSDVFHNRKKNIIALILVLASFYIPTTMYKLINLKYNNHFTITDRGPWALYGNTAKRMKPLNGNKLLAGVYYSVGEEFCLRMLNKDACLFWHYSTSDKYGFEKKNELSDLNYTEQDLNSTLVQLAIDKAKQNPGQYLLMGFIESLKFLFWEFKSMAYVVYSDWLSNLYALSTLKIIINILTALLTLISLLYLFYDCLKKSTKHSGKNLGLEMKTLLCILIFIFMSIGTHSIFFVLPRYTFPLIPLYLIIIPWTIQNLIQSKPNH